MNKHWTAKDIEAAAMDYRAGAATERTACRLGVSRKALHAKMSAVGVKHRLFTPTWTDDESRLAIKLWAEDHTAEAIASRLGKSRNAVLGKLHRCGAMRGSEVTVPKPRRRSHVKSTSSLQAKKTNRGSRPKNPFFLIGKGPAPDCHTVPVKGLRMDTIPTAPASLRMPLASLEKQQCKWPTHEDRGLHLFCGAPAAPDEPYCAYHARAKTARGLRELRDEALQESLSCA